MARSVRHLTEVAALLSERGIDLIVLKQGIDTSTVSGRFTFHVLAAMDQMLAELIAEGTKEGLAAARARGRIGGRPTRLTSRQVEVARAMYSEIGADGKRRYTVDEIAETFAVSRKTIYRNLENSGTRRQPNKSTRPHRATPAHNGSPAASPPATSDDGSPPQRLRPALACPTCGHEPASRPEALQQRADLAIDWLHQDTAHESISQRQHCAACQPQVDCAILECARCGDGPILTGALADQLREGGSEQPPAALRTWLTTHDWQLAPEILCPDHQR
jgi:hypothetical protein